MKIAMIGHKRIPSREGGVEIVVEKLAERMAACFIIPSKHFGLGKSMPSKWQLSLLSALSEMLFQSRS